MATMETFHTIKSLDMTKVRNDINIPVMREPHIPKNHISIQSQFDIVLAQNKNGN